MLSVKSARVICDEMRQAATNLSTAEEDAQRAQMHAYSMACFARRLGFTHTEIAIRMQLHYPGRAADFVKRGEAGGYSLSLGPLPREEKERRQAIIIRMAHIGAVLKEACDILRRARKRAACIAMVANNNGFTYSAIATEMQLAHHRVSYLANRARTKGW